VTKIDHEKNTEKKAGRGDADRVPGTQKTEPKMGLPSSLGMRSRAINAASAESLMKTGLFP
jgi:hypothetical protein